MSCVERTLLQDRASTTPTVKEENITPKSNIKFEVHFIANANRVADVLLLTDVFLHGNVHEPAALAMLVGGMQLPPALPLVFEIVVTCLR